MILSASRRTDIPNYYSDWFFKRLGKGFLYVRNPLNAHQISHIQLNPEVIDCIVFWTKNPENMLGRLDELKNYDYYFQFTVTGYGKDIEPNLPDKRHSIIPTFIKLSRKIGKERVIWRYDPILLSDEYTVDFHVKTFAEFAKALSGYTEKVIISFVDFYAKTQRNTKTLHIRGANEEETVYLALELARIAKENNLAIETCAESVDLSAYGIKHGHCVDKELIERIIGCRISCGKDKNQREECGCYESIEVGAYNTCLNGCRYCYANYSDKQVKLNTGNYNINSPLLCGKVNEDDEIIERKMRSLKDGQIKFDGLI